jgi:crotonobetainyl-CoA:carnitine CoA-transferase CaiB-like acyl-CoA transferase
MPEHGGDTEDVLERWLGMAAHEINRLREGGW